MADFIKVEKLPEFDTASYLNSEAAIAAYLADILAANDSILLAAGLDDLARPLVLSLQTCDALESFYHTFKHEYVCVG